MVKSRAKKRGRSAVPGTMVALMIGCSMTASVGAVPVESGATAASVYADVYRGTTLTGFGSCWNIGLELVLAPRREGAFDPEHFYLGEVTANPITTCDGGVPLTVNLASPATVHALSGLVGGTGDIEITDVAFNVVTSSNPSLCSFQVHGDLRATMDLEANSIAPIDGSSHLYVSNAVGCFGQVESGDEIRLEGEFELE